MIYFVATNGYFRCTIYLFLWPNISVSFMEFSDVIATSILFELLQTCNYSGKN